MNTDGSAIHPFVGNHAGVLFLCSQIVADAVQALGRSLGLRTAVFHDALIERTCLLIQAIVEISLSLLESDGTFRRILLVTLLEFLNGVGIIRVNLHDGIVNLGSRTIVEHAIKNVGIATKLNQRIHLGDIGVVLCIIAVGALHSHAELVECLLVVGILNLVNTPVTMTAITACINHRVRVVDSERAQLFRLQVYGNVERTVSRSNNRNHTATIPRACRKLNEIH